MDVSQQTHVNLKNTVDELQISNDRMYDALRRLGKANEQLKFVFQTVSRNGNKILKL